MGNLWDEQLKKSPKSHLLMVGHFGVGHHYQFQQLLHCCEGYEGVTITFVSDAARCSEVAKLQAKGDFQGIDLRFEPLFGPRPFYVQDPNFPFRAHLTAGKSQREFEPLAKKLVSMKENGLPGVPTCVMSDMMFCFAEEVASQLEVPWYAVGLSPSYSSVCLGAPQLYEEKLHPYESSRRNELLDIPGATFAKVRDSLPEILEFPEYWFDVSERMSRATGLVYNIAEELDAPAGALEAIRAETERKAKVTGRKGPKVFGIGPILNFPGFTGTDTAKSTVMEGTSFASLEFLNGHPVSSVLYVNFGSLGNVTSESLTELALGLEASGVPFLWVLKLSGSLAGATLPPGFEERTKGRGYIERGWAPQAPILLHPSTGGFLSHCGWNLTLESLCCGLPVITWPFNFDQPLNARFLENVAKSAVCVKNYVPGDEKGLRPSRDDVKKSVRLLMIEEEGNDLKKNAEKWKTVLTAAVAEGGSSNKALHELVGEVLQTSRTK